MVCAPLWTAAPDVAWPPLAVPRIGEADPCVAEALPSNPPALAAPLPIDIEPCGIGFVDIMLGDGGGTKTCPFCVAAALEVPTAREP